ncbi:methyltransferase domain-containing protein [Actinokineospora auranticolor]|nr:methyltransferase domain-containing protein [Actinokineospora auranticolor]
MAPILAALGDARTVANVGAGAGSYEPDDRLVIAIEPSGEMVRQRPPGPVVRAVAEALPLRDGAVDAVLGVLTAHHWTDWRAGLAELRRVAPRQVLLAYETAHHADFWFVREYVPEIGDLERGRPSATDIARELGTDEVIPLPLPWDFTDGVFPAYWRRPDAYLDPGVRRATSALSLADPDAVERGVRRLRDDLDTGRWRERHRDLLELDEWDAGFRLVVARG